MLFFSWWREDPLFVGEFVHRVVEYHVQFFQVISDEGMIVRFIIVNIEVTIYQDLAVRGRLKLVYALCSRRKVGNQEVFEVGDETSSALAAWPNLLSAVYIDR